jgi:hypothetical protein
MIFAARRRPIRCLCSRRAIPWKHILQVPGQLPVGSIRADQSWQSRAEGWCYSPQPATRTRCVVSRSFPAPLQLAQ